MYANNSFSIWNSGIAPLLFTTEERWRRAESEWTPECDVEESEEHYLLTLDMPGIPKDQIKLEVVNNELLISGERRPEKMKTDGSWYSERRYGRFHRTFSLPVGVDASKVEAHHRDGTLHVYVPKAESSKPRQIKITNGSSPGFFERLIGQSSSKEKEEKSRTLEPHPNDKVLS